VTKLRLAAIGIGGIGTTHTEAFVAHPSVQLVCVCRRNEEAGRTTAEELGTEYVADYREILARDDVDAVLLSVPNTSHHTMALECLEAGKHVSVEYPITQTVEELDALFQEADERGLVVQDFLTPVHEPQPLKMKELAPRIGKIMTMRSVYIGGPAGWYVDTATRGNFYSALTIHNMVYYSVLLGEVPDWVDGALHLDDEARFHSGLYMCHYPSGVLAFNEWHMGSPCAGTWLWVIEGQKGRLIFDRQQYGPTEIHLQASEGDETFKLVEGRGEADRTAADRFVGRILEGSDEVYVSRDFSRNTLRICEAALESSERGKRVELG